MLVLTIEYQKRKIPHGRFCGRADFLILRRRYFGVLNKILRTTLIAFCTKIYCTVLFFIFKDSCLVDSIKYLKMV